MSFVKELGFSEGMARGERAIEALPAALVYAGFSLDVVPAQMLAQTRPGARGALFYFCIPISEFGQTWPKGVPVQIQGMDADPSTKPDTGQRRRSRYGVVPKRRPGGSRRGRCASFSRSSEQA
jgi:hypothetical protein